MKLKHINEKNQTLNKSMENKDIISSNEVKHKTRMIKRLSEDNEQMKLIGGLKHKTQMILSENIGDEQMKLIERLKHKTQKIKNLSENIATPAKRRGGFQIGDEQMKLILGLKQSDKGVVIKSNFLRARVKGIDDSYSSIVVEKKEKETKIREYGYKVNLELSKNIIRKRALNKLKLNFVKEINDTLEE